MAQAQWMGWAPPPTQKPGKFDFLAPMLESYFKGKEQFNQRQDFRNITAPQRDTSFLSPGLRADLEANDLMPPARPPLQSRAYQGMAGQQALQNRMPMSPMDQARMGLIQAQTGAVGQPSPMHPLTQKNIESQITAREAPTPTTPTQGIAQKKLDLINVLQTSKANGTISKEDNEMLNKMLGGVPPVQITMGTASPSERTAIAETNASIDALNNLKALKDSTKTKTGPITGRTSPALGLIGMTTKDQESFMAATSAFKNAIIKEITGAQMSEVEATRIMKQVPDITDPAPRWDAKWEQSVKNLKMLQARRKEILGQSGIGVPGETYPNWSPEPKKLEDPLGIR